MRKITYLLIFVAAFASSNVASAARFSAVGAVNFSNARDNFDTPYTADQGFGGGIMYQYPLKTKYSLELGAFYLQRRTDQQLPPAGNGGILATSSEIFELQLLYRATFAKLLSKGDLILGVGAFYAYYHGRVQTEGVQSQGYTEQLQRSYLVSFRKRFDGGIVGAIGATFPVKGKTSVLAEFRYTHGLVNGSLDPQASIRFTDVQILLGLSFETK